ncbi:MAG: cytochrome c biogenesis protein CcdA [Mangrovicoccus sp.]|nr:cytochrome c biogenesis protein CcdA [Mangrovicoccus sp.]
MPEITLGAAVFAGLLSFLSPCILPMVPFYLCYLAGQSVDDLRNGAPQRALIGRAVAFALGVTTIFVILGLGASVAGQVLRAWHRELSWVSAAVLLIFGLHFLGLLRLPFLMREARIEGPSAAQGIVPAYVLGLAFGFGWTPCVGPTLSAILLLASGLGDPLQGGMLLAAYGLAMTFPFVLAAGFAGPFLQWLQGHKGWFSKVEQITGAVLILFAVLIASGGLAPMAAGIIELFPALARLG